MTYIFMVEVAQVKGNTNYFNKILTRTQILDKTFAFVDFLMF